MTQEPLSRKLRTYIKSVDSDISSDEVSRWLQGGEGIGRLRLYLALDMKSNNDNPHHCSHYQVNLLKIRCDEQALYADRLFDCSDIVLPLVKVKFCHNNLPVSHRVVRSLACEGFSFLGEQYHFLAYKDLGTDFAFFFPISRKEMFANSLQFWESIGNFVHLPHVPKLAMRLGLLVSGACEGFTLENVDIGVLEDTYIFDSNGNRVNVTEGSGFISEDLSRLLPPKVIQGRIVSPPLGLSCTPLSCDNAFRARDMDFLPNVYQVRLYSTKHGIFKGTLVVCKDLPSHSIRLRKSMQKVEPTIIGEGEAIIDRVTVDVINTSREIKVGNTPDRRDGDTAAVGCMGSDSVVNNIGKLNSHLILLMHESGVSEHVFQELARMHAHRALSITCSREAAMEYCGYFDDQNPNCIPTTKELLYSLLSNGHSLYEPYLQAELLRMQQRELAELFEFRIRCDHCAYLIGIPDPTSSLYIDEVYIPSWSNADIRNVIVTRFPLHHKAAIVKFNLITRQDFVETTAVNDKNRYNESENVKQGERKISKILAMLQNNLSSAEGVIVFGTRVRPCQLATCPVATMEGDFDGDKYFVCGYHNIVDKFQCNLHNAWMENHSLPPSITTVSSDCDHDLHQQGLLDEISSVMNQLYLDDYSELSAIFYDTKNGRNVGTTTATVQSHVSYFNDDEPPLLEAPVVMESVSAALDCSNHSSIASNTITRSDDENALSECHFINSLVTQPSILVSFSQVYLVESVIWEWLGEVVHALGVHTLDFFKNDKNDRGNDEENKENLFSLCDHARHENIKRKIKFFEKSNILISRCALNWIVEADIYGSTSTTCCKYALLHDLCLKNRKDCYQLLHNLNASQYDHCDFDIPTYPLLKPHYLSENGAAQSSRINSYHSTSVLGRLFDYMQGAVMAMEQDMRLTSKDSLFNSDIVLDPDYKHEAIRSVFAAEEDFEVVEEAVSSLPQNGVRSGYDKKASIEKSKVLQYATNILTRFMNQMNLHNSLQCKGYTLHFETARNKEASLGRKSDLAYSDLWSNRNVREKIIIYFRQKFEDLARRLDDEIGNESKRTSVKGNIEDVRDIPSATAYCLLAGALYEVAYVEAKNASKRRKDQSHGLKTELKLLSAPWLICGSYLNRIKSSNLCKAVNESNLS